MNFGQAIEAMKAGQRVSRAGWNGKAMFVYLQKGSKPDVHPGAYGGVMDHLFEYGNRGTSVRMPNINMRAADGSIVTGWLASQTDMLAEDWGIAQ